MDTNPDNLGDMEREIHPKALTFTETPQPDRVVHRILHWTLRLHELFKPKGQSSYAFRRSTELLGIKLTSFRPNPFLVRWKYDFSHEWILNTKKVVKEVGVEGL